MSDTINKNETWQVDVGGQVYEAGFSEFVEWIVDGSLQPEDLVRRGNLRWIEAQKVPKLAPFFNAKANGLAPKIVVIEQSDTAIEVSDTAKISDDANPAILHRSGPGTEPTWVEHPVNSFNYGPQPAIGFNEDRCADHGDRPSKFICRSCSRPSCSDCVNRFGSSVAVCKSCGGMCISKTELETIQHKDELRANAIGAGFGFGDFIEAISYPFRFKTSLFFGALMFMFFSLGRMATSMGGIYMIVAAIFSYMLANMLAFGILSNTIDNFAKGLMNANFMPEFEDFSLWDDVIHPFFLSIGVYISAFGPFIAVFLVGTYLVMSSMSSQLDSMKANLENTPGTPYYSARDTLDQSEQVKSVLDNAKRINQEHLEAQENLEKGQPPVVADQQEEKILEINKFIAENKRKELESVVGKTSETRERESAAFFYGMLKLAAPLVVVGFITFLWGLFFFPAVCSVAGYTRSFMATVNPLVGLDTIKRLGLDYAKILLMGLILLMAFVIVSMLLAAILVAFDMPGFGNLPARALESVVWFYFVIVFACVLGIAIFKASDRLRLYS